MILVRVIGAADGTPTPHDGRYVVAWNPHVEAGTLAMESTDDPDEARRFTVEEAMNVWNTVSRVQPRRPWDGAPNRPLSAVTVELLTAA